MPDHDCCGVCGTCPEEILAEGQVWLCPEAKPEKGVKNMSRVLVQKLQQKIDEIEAAPVWQQPGMARLALNMAMSIIVDHSNRIDQLERKRADDD